MGKKKSGFKKPNKKGVDSLRDAASSSDDEAIEQHLQSVLEDEIDQYNAFKEKSLADKAKPGKKRKARPDEDEEEQEVYDLGLTSSEEEEDGAEQEDFMKGSGDEEDKNIDLDDSEDDDDEDDEEIMGKRDQDYGIPDSRAWGKKAKVFHNTDYVDQDFGGFEGSDAEMAELEEAEAKEIQKRLTAELDEEDFLGLIPLPVDKPQKISKTKEVLKVDYDNMSIAEKRKLVQRECPELIHMVDEYKEKLQEAKGLRAAMTSETDQFLRKFFQSKYHSILNYCINISYYLYLRATSPTNCKGHPVIKRIVQFRRLLDELSQFNILKYKSSHERTPRLKPKKKLKKKSLPNKLSKQLNDDTPMGQALSMDESKELEDDADDPTLDKRGITYQIAKNKGLTPKRKREQRNPRVKHREKFRKAVIRRKGQVRTPRTELQRYSGEMTGIKTHLTKSIKLK